MDWNPCGPVSILAPEPLSGTADHVCRLETEPDRPFFSGLLEFSSYCCDMHDLRNLGWNSFRELCLTITREILGKTVESFLDSVRVLRVIERFFESPRSSMNGSTFNLHDALTADQASQRRIDSFLELTKDRITYSFQLPIAEQAAILWFEQVLVRT